MMGPNLCILVVLVAVVWADTESNIDFSLRTWHLIRASHVERTHECSIFNTADHCTCISFVTGPFSDFEPDLYSWTNFGGAFNKLTRKHEIFGWYVRLFPMERSIRVYDSSIAPGDNFLQGTIAHDGYLSWFLSVSDKSFNTSEGNCKRAAWLLSRTPLMDKEQEATALGFLSEMAGINPESLKTIDHSDCS